MFQPKRISSFLLPVAFKASALIFLVVLCYQAFTIYKDSEESWQPQFPFRRQQDPTSLIKPHGGDRCLPPSLPDIPHDAKILRNACKQVWPYPESSLRIGRVSAHFGDAQEHYQKALHTHALHSMIHNNRLDVMCSPMVDSLWNKPAFILSLLLDEMLKPPSKRLEWLFWVDRDTLILDQCRPISSFLPFEEPALDEKASEGDESDEEAEEKVGGETHLIVTNDWNGLNNGVFLVRVNQWAVDLFSDINAFRYYRPNVSLPFTEQSAMEIVMKEPKFEPNVQVVPQYWFNAYPQASPGDFETKTDTEGLKPYHARRGDFLLHFAGRGGRDKLINEWTDMLVPRGGLWLPEEVQRDNTRGIRNFWSRFG